MESSRAARAQARATESKEPAKQPAKAKKRKAAKRKAVSQPSLEPYHKDTAPTETWNDDIYTRSLGRGIGVYMLPVTVTGAFQATVDSYRCAILVCDGCHT